MPVSPRACAVALLVAVSGASLAGCQQIGGILGGGGGVMPDSDVGLPPSMRGAVKNAPARTTTNLDDDGQPVASAPSRALALPKNVKADTRSADAGPRRISRDEIEGGDAGGSGRGGSGGLTPSLTPGGGVGMGGRF